MQFVSISYTVVIKLLIKKTKKYVKLRGMGGNVYEKWGYWVIKRIRMEYLIEKKLKSSDLEHSSKGKGADIMHKMS